MKEEKTLHDFLGKKEKTLEELIAVHDLLKMHAPDAILLDLIKRDDEYIVLYRDDNNPCTPYIIHHLTDSGLYLGSYYASGYDAWVDFDKMR